MIFQSDFSLQLKRIWIYDYTKIVFVLQKVVEDDGCKLPVNVFIKYAINAIFNGGIGNL